MKTPKIIYNSRISSYYPNIKPEDNRKYRDIDDYFNEQFTYGYES